MTDTIAYFPYPKEGRAIPQSFAKKKKDSRNGTVYVKACRVSMTPARISCLW